MMLNKSKPCLKYKIKLPLLLRLSKLIFASILIAIAYYANQVAGKNKTNSLYSSCRKKSPPFCRKQGYLLVFIDKLVFLVVP
jgi:hypothetical protein